MLRFPVPVDLSAESFLDGAANPIVAGGVARGEQADGEEFGRLLIDEIEPDVPALVQTQVPHSKRQPLHRLVQVAVRGLGVQERRVNAAVAVELLHCPDICQFHFL